MSPRPKDHAVTLATVAEAVGVSRMTVSNAYNRPDQLSPELRDRILKAAERLGYSGPNPVARTLSRGKTGSVGLVLDYPLTVAFTDPGTVQFLHGVAAGCEAEALGLTLVPRIEGGGARLIQNALVDGFVLYCVHPGDVRMDAVLGRKLPFVRVDFDPEPGMLDVNIDDETGARMIAEHLTALGHRRIGIALPHAHPVDTGPDKLREAGRVAGGRLLDRADRPTAIIALSDVLALGVIEAAAERGISVPGELSVAGFDDVPEAAAATPPLTTLRQPHQLKGSEAVRMLIEGPEAQSVLLPIELVVRAST